MNERPVAGAVLFAKNMQQVADFYAAVAGFSTVSGGDDHVVLESPVFQLVVHRMPGDIASGIQVTMPPARRANGAVKLVFPVQSLVDARATVAAYGGVLEGPDREWTFQGWRVCDGLDPEGNVVQLRQRIA